MVNGGEWRMEIKGSGGGWWWMVSEGVWWMVNGSELRWSGSGQQIVNGGGWWQMVNGGEWEMANGGWEALSYL